LRICPSQRPIQVSSTIPHNSSTRDIHFRRLLVVRHPPAAAILTSVAEVHISLEEEEEEEEAAPPPRLHPLL
jgi:hypothetical protein